jgi:hypothetical protein
MVVGACRPYLVVSVAFAVVSIPYLTVKSVMLRHNLAGKWGVLLLACGLFSVAHVFVAMNVNLFARRQQQMGLLGQVFPSSSHRIVTPPPAPLPGELGVLIPMRP